MDTNKKLKRVLVVEDDVDLRGVLVDRLKGINADALEASDGEQAIDMTITHKPDLILLDLLLPKVDGFKVLERVRHYPEPSIAQIPVVVLSNLWSNKDILRAQALSIDEYYVKANTSLDEVFAKIKQIFDNKQQTKA